MTASRLLPLFLALCLPVFAVEAGKGDLLPEPLRKPLSKVDALNIALQKNGTIRQAQCDVEAAYGIAIQTRAILLPRLGVGGNYAAREDSLIEANRYRQLPSTTVTLPTLGALQFGGGESSKINNQAWSGDIQLVQSIYEGGRMLSAVRSSGLLRDQALLVFQSTIADTLLLVSTAYDNVLAAAKQVEVRAASVELLSSYLDLSRKKLAGGVVTDFEVFRDEVEVVNAQAQLIDAQGIHRVAKQRLAELLGFSLPAGVSDDLPLKLTTELAATPFPGTLEQAITEALANRPEIAALKKEEALRQEDIIVARSGYKPSVQAFGGYELTSRSRTRNAGDYSNGGIAGAQVSWPLFDGFLTKGRVDQAKALRRRATEATEDTVRQIELQVRSAWSDLRKAQAVLVAQEKNIERAVQALDLARLRYDAGTGLQIDVLSAQTALTDARGSFVEALRAFSVARARLIRATGRDLKG